jgi:uncharacterized protein
MQREFRSLSVRELRAEDSEGKRYLTGYAALYNVRTDLYWCQELIKPGAFTRAIAEKQDVRHLINHDANLVLGRTSAGTTELSEDSKGLKFRTLLPETSFAQDLFVSVQRGDINECSFGFYAMETVWREEQDPQNPDYELCIREIEDLDLFDISTVTFPAYAGTNTDAETKQRSIKAMFPDGVPAEMRSRMTRADAVCECSCPECVDGDCDECSNEDCADENCRCDMRSRRAAAAKPAKTKKVDGEDLTSDCFLMVGVVNDTRTWKLAVKFTDDAKRRTHLHNALFRFNELKHVNSEQRAGAWPKLVALCREHAIDHAAESLRSKLTPQQIDDLSDAGAARLRLLKQLEVEASL